LDAALQAAHNIQDPIFCARSTARWNAMYELWWRSDGFDVTAQARQLAEDPSAPAFAALHRVGESYFYRLDHLLPLPWLGQDTTLRALADIYQRPVAEFQRLNSEWGWAPETPLSAETLVRVPDPGFAPLLAARFAAESLVAPALGQQDRVRLIQILVPVAVSDMTALDTVLARLLLAARPSDPAVLDALAKLWRKPWAKAVT
jgi:hypothetical protein